MGSKTKVRFYARVHNGGEAHNAQLIAVRQLGNGDLIVNLIANRYFENGEPLNVPLVEQRFTVHVSPQSHGHTLTHTIILGNGDTIRNVAFYDCRDRPLIASLFARRWPSLMMDHFGMRHKGRDILKKVVSYDERFNNLITHVCVLTKGYGCNLHDLIGGKMHSFDHFDLIVSPMFISWPAIEQGDFVQLQSADQQYNDDRGEGRYSDLVIQDEHEALDYLEALTDKLWNRLKERIDQFPFDNPVLSVVAPQLFKNTKIDTMPFEGLHYLAD